MVVFLRRLAVLTVGIVLLVAPTMIRDNLWQYNSRSYTPPEVPPFDVAATPVPTPTAVSLNDLIFTRGDELRAGPVVIDLAHYNFLDPSSTQPLADALADRGLGVRYWLSTIDPMSVVNYLEYPDQSEELAAQLADASALMIVSPYFLWTPEEITVVEQFVADGGRLLLISDPDIMGDYAAATNMIGEPFGVVFNEDYLYDTTTNDGNYTFFFQASLLVPEGDTAMAETAAPLTDSTIAFYGGRSLSGDLRPVLQSVETTRSSLRVGRSGFTTAAIAGLAERGTAGRVLALSDLDVMTEPYRQRHDNQRMVDYVADFLSADERVNRVADFPHYLGKEVALAFGASDAINADLILQGAQIQQQLERSGRSLFLTDSGILSGTVSGEGMGNSEAVDSSIQAQSSYTSTDVIYLAAYTTAMSQTTILRDLGIELYREIVTKTVPIATPTPTPSSAPGSTNGGDSSTEADSDESNDDDTSGNGDGSLLPPPETPPPPLTGTVPITATGATVTATELSSFVPPVVPSLQTTVTVPPTATVPATTTTPVTTTPPISATTPATATTGLTATAGLTTTAGMTATPQFEVRTIITTYLRTAGGLTFLADETVLVIRAPQPDDHMLLAVLAANNRGIDTGVNRLLENDFTGCVIGDLLTFCALAPTDNGTTASAPAAPGEAADESQSASGTGEEGEPSTPDTPSAPANSSVLLIDDNSAAGPSELSEADLYLQQLLAGGYQVDLWSVGDQGDPNHSDFSSYGWVIWSNAGYADGAIDNGDLETIFTFVSQGGRLTISSRTPLPGLEGASPIRDLVLEADAEELTDSLPTSPISLDGTETTSAVLNAIAEGDPATQVALRRGPASENADAPALVVLADPTTGDREARLLIAAFSMAWLPEAEQATLIANMASYMLRP